MPLPADDLPALVTADTRQVAPMPDAPPSVGIVGAGMAGLACARALVQGGIGVTIIDKGRRPGGRLATRETDGWQFDHGAQFFTARDPQFRQCVDEWQALGLVARWQGRLVSLKTDDRQPAETAAAERFVAVPRMQALATHLAGGLDVVSGVTIARLGFTDAAWHLYRDDGADAGGFDYVVLAVPAPQAAALVEGTTLALDARSILMAPCWTLLLGSDRRLALDYDGAFIAGGALAWAARDASKPGRPSRETWVVQASPEWSMAHLEDGADSVKAALVREFSALTGVPMDDGARYTAVHRWRYALATLQRIDPFLYDSDLRIGLCGDWCGGARVEGAFISGRAMAARLLEDIAQAREEGSGGAGQPAPGR